MSEVFKLIGFVEVGPLREALYRERPRFEEETWRQDHPLSPHTDTKTIYLRGMKEVSLSAVMQDMNPIDYPALDVPEFRIALDQIVRAINRPPARAMIISLRPGGEIRRHFDGGPYAENTQRYHLAITSNPYCLFHVDHETHNLKSGELVWFDKSKWHRFHNGGDNERSHLVVDFF